MVPLTPSTALSALSIAVVLVAFWSAAAWAVVACVITPALSCAWSGAACTVAVPIAWTDAGVWAMASRGRKINNWGARMHSFYADFDLSPQPLRRVGV